MRYPWLLIPIFGRGVSLFMVLSADLIGQKGQIMAKKEFTANYNGEAIRPGEVMIPFEYTELDAEICSNPECVKTLTVGGKLFKVIYKAVPEQWAKVGASALTLVQNEELGHYSSSNAVSMDEMMDEYELALGETPSAEEEVIQEDEFCQALDTFISLMHTLIEKSGKLAYAVLLTHVGIKGEEFYCRMKLTRDPAHRVQRQAAVILRNGISNLDITTIKGYKNKHEEEYKAEAYKLLDQIVAMYR